MAQFQIPCPYTFEENPQGAEMLLEMFQLYMPAALQIVNVIPFLKDSNENTARCKWQIIAEDTEHQRANNIRRNTLLDFLEVNKPRNSEAVVLQYTGGKTWCITYSIARCHCPSVFSETKLARQFSSNSILQKLKESKNANKLCYKINVCACNKE